MDSSGSKNILCRICLDENVSLDWNSALVEHCDVSYKDCYYKYTQLNQLDDDPLSHMLCKTCSNSLEDMHLLVLKALDSYNFLLEVNSAKIGLKEPNTVDDEANCSTTVFETVMVEKLDADSKLLEENENESFEEFSVKSEDELDKSEDDTQYQEIMEVEEEEFDENQVAEYNDVEEDNVYESSRKKIKKSTSSTRKYNEDPNSDEEINVQKPSTQSMKMRKKPNSSKKLSKKSEDEKLHNPIDDEFQYEQVCYTEDEQNEYETSQGTDMDHTEEEVSTVYAATRKKHKGSQSHTLELVKVENDGKRKKRVETKRRKTNKTRDKTQLNSQNTPSMCSYCSKILHNKYALQKHEKTHLDRERKAPCPICGVKFLQESYVKIHMQIHNQDRVKKHQCEFCDKAFYEKGSLNVHRRVHLGQMIPCLVCGKEFFRQVDLEIHMSSHSTAPITAETKKRSRYWVRCKYCNKDIMSTSFKYHTAVHLNEPQMKCSICDREFFRRDSCTDHLKTVHKKAVEEYSNFIILYNKNRLSHLYLEQTTELKK